MSNLLSIGRTGLLAAQTGIATTGHNITNSSVPGYTRQGIVQSTLPPLNQGVGYVGTGTQVAQIKRYYDDFLNKQVMNAQSTQGSVDAYLTQMTQIDNMLSDASIGLSPALQDFFRGVQTANSNPSLQSSRTSMLSSAETLAARFHEVSGRLQELQEGVNTDITNTVNGINSYAAQIANLNNQIATLTTDPLNPPNDLLDQRDQLVRELNQQVKVTVLPSDNNMLNITFGSGQPLVVGTSHLEMRAVLSPTDPGRLVVSYPSTGRSTIIGDDTFAGGALGGLMDFRRESLDRVQNQIGQVAAGLTQAFNEQHRLGQDLNGDLGGDFFTPLKGYVGYDAGNSPLSTLEVDATITDARALTGLDYELNFDGDPPAYSITRSDGQVFTDLSVPIDGVTYTLTGDPQAGDRVQVRPTYTAAADFDVAITDYRKIALAAPVTTSVPTTNSGNGTISPGVVNEDYIGNQLAAPVTLTFTGGEITGFPDGSTVPYEEGTTLSFGGISFSISGTPAEGDTFIVGPNTSGVGDARNGVLLAGLQTSNILNNGTSTFQGAYAATVNFVGNKTRELQVGSAAADTTVDQAIAAQQSVSGVNLDEEAANLLRYQQAYQAAGKVMQVAGTLFDTLLSIGQ
ncbi:flagellar hook-associated protein FlgK [Pseudoduganella albidiflava]|uniref:Flagellar hook-associated protein 1 n=1 Tax=Pseudoduganella albidiflava TaxID=321983 RepID=A0A411WU64_9BURK|nr:flagellar hook-associated protein FlgK [Pseudoduganella albidiflava]QBI00188.1 flagellar hook-associated protein FlgK [Pseudoduganella albidiflava]GGY66508.1 flagellar hook-associated protein FlgK [Pseudoduganella albidiflava]